MTTPGTVVLSSCDPKEKRRPNGLLFMLKTLRHWLSDGILPSLNPQPKTLSYFFFGTHCSSGMVVVGAPSPWAKVTVTV